MSLSERLRKLLAVGVVQGKERAEVGSPHLGPLEHRLSLIASSPLSLGAFQPGKWQGGQGLGGAERGWGIGEAGLEDAKSCPQPQELPAWLLTSEAAPERPSGNREKFISGCAIPNRLAIYTLGSNGRWLRFII